MKIGIIDYSVSNYHTKTYPKLIKKYNEANGTNFEVKYVWAEFDNEAYTTQTWCETYGAERLASIKELCEKSDFVLIVAPDRPDKHLGYAEEVFKCGHSPFIDKTFAPNYETAVKIFELAEKYGVTFFSSSALRFAPELDAIKKTVKSLTLINGGGAFVDHAIHFCEIVVKCMGKGAEKVFYERFEDQEWVDISYPDGRRAKVMYSKWMPYGVIAQDESGESKYVDLGWSFFEPQVADILRFAQTKTPSFDTTETLECMKLLDAVLKAKENEKQWINL